MPLPSSPAYFTSSLVTPKHCRRRIPRPPQAIKPQLSDLEGLRQRNAVLTTAKDELTAQLEHYADKFAEFQETLTKSNEVRAGGPWALGERLTGGSGTSFDGTMSRRRPCSFS